MAAGSHAWSVEALAQLGVFEGTECGEGLFCPGEPVLRWAMAVWLVRVLGAPLPDGLTHSVLVTSNLIYWGFCGSTGTLPTAAERSIFTASVTGAIPDWFIDTYGGDTTDKAAVWTEEYTGDTAAVWTDVMKLPRLPRIALVRMLRNLFGGYCSDQIAKDAAFNDSGRASPWAAADCRPNPATDVVLDRGATSLTRWGLSCGL